MAYQIIIIRQLIKKQKYLKMKVKVLYILMIVMKVIL